MDFESVVLGVSASGWTLEEGFSIGRGVSRGGGAGFSPYLSPRTISVW